LHFNKNSRRLSLNKIFISKAEIKHSNSKAILTVYAYNREKIALLNKIRDLKISFYREIKILCSKFADINFGCEAAVAVAGPASPTKKKEINNLKIKTIIALLSKELLLLRKYKLKLNLNKYKFEEKLLYKLKNLITKYYNKKIEFNIVNIKSIILNSDLFTKIVTVKLKKRQSNILGIMDIILNKAVLPQVNKIKEKSLDLKKVDLNLISNMFKVLNLSSIAARRALNTNNLSELLNKLYFNIFLNTPLYFRGRRNDAGLGCEKKDYQKIYEIIFNSINFKNMGGIRLEVKGRLTKRYRADRATFKLR
jgi:hypothetical protein